MPKSIQIESLRDVVVWEIHTRWKTKYIAKGTQIKLIELPINIK